MKENYVDQITKIAVEVSRSSHQAYVRCQDDIRPRHTQEVDHPVSQKAQGDLVAARLYSQIRTSQRRPSLGLKEGTTVG